MTRGAVAGTAGIERGGSGTVRFALSGGQLYSYLAMLQGEQLDRTFRALGDGTRRAILHELARGQARTAGELGRHFSSAQPTISKHLKVLEDARLIERTVVGRVHWFSLQPKGLREATRWLTRHQAFWEGAVDQLEQLLAKGNAHDGK